MRIPLAAGLLLALQVMVSASYCDLISPPVVRCVNTAPRDLLFLVDGSNSMDPARFYGEMIEYTQALYCAFDPSANNQAGMIVFNNEITEYVPLGMYTQDEWLDRTQEVRDTEFSANPACCSCCTPTAEAFVKATEVLSNFGVNVIQIVFVITDGVPSNNDAGSPGGDPAYWFVSVAYGGFNPAEYNARVVGEKAADLKRLGLRLMIVGVPNWEGKPPEVAFFSGTGIYSNVPRKIEVSRGGKRWEYMYRKPPNPIVSVPVDKHAFSSVTWNVTSLVGQTVGAMCEITMAPTNTPTRLPTKQPTTTSAPSKLPTKLPTSQRPTPLPTKLPTKLPTTMRPTQLPTSSPTAFYFEQVDLTFIVDRSNSMIWRNEFCANILKDLPAVFPAGGQPSSSACWELFMRYILRQSDYVAAIGNAGPQNNRVLGWAGSFPGVQGKGLRVQVIGFACTNKQKTPRMFDFSDAFNNYEAITTRAKLIALLDHIRVNVTPFGGTCPGLSIEQSVKYVERSPFNLYPYQAAILVTDGVFYDMPFPERATKGLEAYKVMRFSVGIAVANKKGEKYGLTEKEIATQSKQLNAFAGAPGRFMNLGELGWATLLQDVSQTISDTIASQGPQLMQYPPIPRYTWCGWRRVTNCQMDNWRMNNCRWGSLGKTQWACRRQ